MNPSEATLVKDVFALYLDGFRGRDLGVHGIAAHLNQRGITVRGSRWNKGRVHDLLTNRAYVGEHYFNRYEKHRGPVRKLKPRQEWVLIEVEPIVSEETFALVQSKLESRSPAQIPPRIVNSPTLLTGLLKCGVCGAGMTVATGKGGRYRYYKCASRILKGRGTCSSGNLPMDQLDRLILTALADRVFCADRVQTILDKLRKRLGQTQGQQDESLKRLTKDFESLQQRQTQLYEELLTAMAGLRRARQMPLNSLSHKQILAFTAALREKLFEKGGGLGKKYLKLLVEEIRYQDKEIVMKGSYSAMAQAVGGSKLGTLSRVPSFGLDWLPGQDSNLRPAG
jgi:site-specific DNA recombinase